MKSSIVSFVSILLTLVSLPALARETPIVGSSPRVSAVRREQPEVPVSELASDSRQQHHRGFFLRAEIGGGYRSLSAEANGLAVHISGAGGGASLLAGGTPLSNLVLVGELSLSAISNPSVQVGSHSAEPDGASATWVAFGPGAIYYVMPANAWLGGSLLLSRFKLSRNGETVAESKLGVGGIARVGKEWPVGRDMGIGLSAQGSLAAMKDESEDTATWLGAAFTLSATLTYN